MNIRPGDPVDGDAVLAIIALLEESFGGNELTPADIEQLLAPWARNGRPLLAVALRLLRFLIADAVDIRGEDPAEIIARFRRNVLKDMAQWP